MTNVEKPLLYKVYCTEVLFLVGREGKKKIEKNQTQDITTFQSSEP